MTEDNKPAENGEPIPLPEDTAAAETDAAVSADNPPPAKRGRMRFQDDRTEPRAPTLGEQRARRRALAEQERESTEVARKAQLRRKIMIGSGVTIGVVATVAVWYTAVAGPETTAVCTDNSGKVVDDQFCDENYYQSHGGFLGPAGFIFLGGNSYRYNYGGTGAIGQPVTGGSFTQPSSNTTVKTKSGSTVQRGGFGLSGGGKSGGS